MSSPRSASIMGSDSRLADHGGRRRRAGRVRRSRYEVRRRLGAPHAASDARLRPAAPPAAGCEVIIAGAGGAAHLPGMVASVTPLPVIGVPVPLTHLDGIDSLLSIVQMPAGVPVATVSIGGARNAGLLAVRILATADDALQARVVAFAESLETLVEQKEKALQASLTS